MSNTSNKPARNNKKTVLCKFFVQKGECPYADRCTYAHGPQELVKPAPRSINSPCWYFNHGGCTKAAEKCLYNHVIDPNMRKPIHLQHPCPFFHHKTPGQCKSEKKCSGDHFYELAKDEWVHHFPDIPYPGVGYTNRKNVSVTEEFPVLSKTQPPPKTIIGGAWIRPLEIKEPSVALQERVPRKPASGSWADYSSEEEDDFFIEQSNKRAFNLDSLDGELKEMVNEVVKQLLEKQ